MISSFIFTSAATIEIVDQEQTNCGGTYWATSYPGKLVQSFTPAQNVLTKVHLYGWKNETPQNSLKISIRDSLNGKDLTSVIVQPSQIKNYVSSWFEADFPNISVIPETIYYLVWSPIEGDENEPHFLWCYMRANPGGDPYDRGSQILNGEEIERADFCFKTYGYSIPTVTIDYPTDGVDLGGITIIEGTADDIDGSIQKVEIKIDDNPWTQVMGLTNWDYTWDTRTVSNGVHTISARSYDGESFSQIISINVVIRNSVLSIEDIIGGFSVVGATIHNSGDEVVHNIAWSIEAKGGVFNLVNLKTTGSISSISEDGEINIKTDKSFFGLGPLLITITVEAINANDQIAQKNGFIIGTYVLLR